MISSPVWASRWMSRVGSSSRRRRSAATAFSSSPRLFGSNANDITGFGNSSGGADSSRADPQSRSPAWVPFSFGTTPMSPGPRSSTCSSLPPRIS